MDANLASEIAYKNGFSAAKNKTEMCTRIEVAYEQLGKVHTELCRQCKSRNDNELIYDVQDALNAILKVEVKLGMIKRKEDIV